ncbi:MAG: type II toxin-antitoxin system VapC family toxin [Pacificimonas sp.]
MSGFVYDASAILAFLKRERGGERVMQVADHAVMSAVNYSEVVAKIHEGGGDIEVGVAALENLRLSVLPFGAQEATEAGRLQSITHRTGISFGDRACISLAQMRDATALTTDLRWSELPDGIAKIEQMR